MVVRALVSTLALVLGLAVSPAAAQIYVSRDAAGTILLSDQPLAGAVRTYAVRNATNVRTTRGVAADVEGIYDKTIEAASATHGVRPELVRAVIQVESGFNPRARSRVGAMGLMQLMPATAADLGVDNPWDPVQNINGGVAYLGSLIREFGDEVLALAAYNAGPGAVNRYGQRVPPYRETQDYVQKIARKTDTMPVARGRRTVIYKVLEEVDGQTQWRLTDTKPTSGHYEVIR
ncbi:Soluble lytic murein transglycosylase precursor [Luteitalea pratensis]|uniref:Soluble lytic murein transglycosylase n=1 Tax=Luteitalea pratensis TaxID=1855912 RepID=A0A143PTK4_LUTPR|nr:transglycosylase SLT domain-containing protein [Luteitalea pratensis]AMY11159.1 Soluble lytic murein transglycosylase precursor [Luteitalea pratensis]